MMSASLERSLAREVVTRVRERSAFAHETLDAVLRGRDLARERRAFVARLAYGTIAARGTLDDAVARYLAQDVRLQSLVADCLALSAYEILFTRTPARAAVNEGVELVRAVAPRAASLANAVLRRLSGDAADFPWGDPGADDAALARLTGHPEWLVTRLVAELGRPSASAVLAADNEPAPLFLAHMPFKASFADLIDRLERDGAEPHPIVGLEGAIACSTPAAAVASPALSEGWAIVVDAGAQYAAGSVPLAAGGRIVDVGAGRGTKSLLLAARAHRAGVPLDLVAVDSHAFKLEALQSMAATVYAPTITSLATDAASLSAVVAPSSVDAVLVDAPCSGLGTLRRHPDRRWRAREDEIDALAALGGTLLASAAEVVKPGGFVVYSTCTIVRAENEEVIEGFLASPAGSGFALDALDPQSAPESWSPYFAPRGTFMSLPSAEGPDGHFVARLRREV